MTPTQNNSFTNLDSAVMAEQSVLGAILLEPERLDDIRFLEARDFTIDRHRLLWEALVYMDNRDETIDLLTVVERLDRRGRLEEMGGVSYISQLTSSCPSTSATEDYAKIVRKNGHRKRLHQLSDQVRTAADGDYDTEEDMFDAVEELTADIRPQESGEMLSMAETREAYKRHLKSMAEKLTTGFQQFDEWAKLWRGWLYVLAGRPSVGKTAKMLQLIYGVAKHNLDAGCILVFTQEMSAEQLKDRLVSMISGVNYVKLTKNKENLTEKDYEKINAALDELDRLPIFIEDKSAVTIDEIRATARRFKKKYKKIALIAVDYLQIMKIPDGKNRNRDQGIGIVTSQAKSIARKYKTCFLMLSQMSREIEKGGEREPKLSDLRESGSIEQDADVVEFLWHKQGEMEDNCKIIRSYFAKGRDVGENRFRYKFEWWMQRYKELPKAGDSSG